MPASPTWGDHRLGLRNTEDRVPAEVPARALGQYFWTLRQREDSLQGFTAIIDGAAPRPTDLSERDSRMLYLIQGSWSLSPRRG